MKQKETLGDLDQQVIKRKKYQFPSLEKIKKIGAEECEDEKRNEIKKLIASLQKPVKDVMDLLVQKQIKDLDGLLEFFKRAKNTQ